MNHSQYWNDLSRTLTPSAVCLTACYLFGLSLQHRRSAANWLSAMQPGLLYSEGGCTDLSDISDVFACLFVICVYINNTTLNICGVRRDGDGRGVLANVPSAALSCCGASCWQIWSESDDSTWLSKNARRWVADWLRLGLISHFASPLVFFFCHILLPAVVLA